MDQGWKDYHRNLSRQDKMHPDHVRYLTQLSLDYEPNVIYDIGACVLHWTRPASLLWPKAKIYLFEGWNSIEYLYQEEGFDYNMDVLSDVSGKELTFYQSDESPGGNSYYKENSWATDIYYGPESEVLVKTKTLDDVVSERGFEKPDLMKIDVQGCELDILKGATNTIQNCQHLIVELQHTNYNDGAPMDVESIPYIESLGFELVAPRFANNGPDADYHFKRK